MDLEFSFGETDVSTATVSLIERLCFLSITASMLLTSLIDGKDLRKPRQEFRIEVDLSGAIFCSFLWSPLINHLLLKRQRWCRGWNTTYWMTWKCREHSFEENSMFSHA